MATSLADFHQMIKLFGGDTDEINVIPTAVATIRENEDDRDDDEEEEEVENERELPIDEDLSSPPMSTGGDEEEEEEERIDDHPQSRSTTKPISSAAAAARLSRLANQRMDSNRFLICSGTNSYNTIRKTKHEVRRFALYLEDTFQEKCPIDELKPEQLCTYLKHYFGNVRKADNTEYEPDTLRSFMLSIERYLKSRKYPYNILESPVFAVCREVIQEKRDTWAKPTKNLSNSKVEAFTSEHELLLRRMNIITRETPEGLLLELLINNSKYFDQRGNESTINRSLLWGDLQIQTDPTNGNEYIEYTRSTSNLRAYANPTQAHQCPVASLRLFTYHRPTQCSNADAPFYLVPRTSTDQRVWYKTIRAGRHRLDLLIQQAMQKAGIEGKFSCMSVRKGKIKGLLIPTNHSDLLDLSSNPSKKLKREIATSMVIKPILPLEPQCENHQDEISTPISSNSNKRQLTSNDTFNALYSAAHLKSSRQSKINLLRKYLEETLGLVEFLTLYEYLSRNSYIKLQGTPIEHYEHILPVLLTLLMLENTA